MDDFLAQCVPHYQMVFRYVLALSRNRRIAEDVTQETFVKAFEGFGKFRGDSGVSTWLCQIAKNTYFSHLKREKSYALTDEMPEGTDDAVEASYLQKERALATHRALHAMREPYKEVLTLRVFGELEYAQIAALFQKSESWARVTFYRAKEMLRETMEVDSDE